MSQQNKNEQNQPEVNEQFKHNEKEKRTTYKDAIKTVAAISTIATVATLADTKKVSAGCTAGTCGGSCSSCTGTCSWSCSGGCKGCGSGCASSCTGGCKGGCGGCDNGCTGSCKGGCGGCDNGCSGSCKGSCTECGGGCSSSCTGGCKGGCGGCDNGCSGSCKGSCTGCGSGCASTCSGGCKGSCSSCSYGCANNCSGGCSGGCKASAYASYAIILDGQGATYAGTTSVNVIAGNNISSITPPTRNYYTFDGYYTGPNGTGEKYIDALGRPVKAWDNINNISAEGSTSYASSTATLYANWIPVNYSIDYETHGGKFTNDVISHKRSDNINALPRGHKETEYNVESEDIILENPKRKGMKFKEWKKK